MKKRPEVAAIIVAAGVGKRFGGAKQFACLAGRPLVEWSIEAFTAHPEVAEVVVVLPDESRAEEIKSKWTKVKAVVKGGKERLDSVARGMEAVSKKIEFVLVHDGVRPLVSAELISKIIQAASHDGAAVPALPIEETVKLIESDKIVRTLRREKMVRVQTPQGFKKAWLEKALIQAKKDGYYGPDDASLLERLGLKVVIIPGDRKNIKITTPDDIKLAEVWLNEGRDRL